ncbi:MAG: RNA methyltransferase [Acidobacteria bacterium]|nr:RNA methyltransferase [Acidobacteriota bacterium]
MQTLILGKHNPKILDVRKAIEQGTLTQEGLLPIEGVKLLEEAARSGIGVVSIFLRRGTVPPDITPNVPVYEIEPAAFKSIQATETSTGLIALVRPPRFSLHDILPRGHPLITLLVRLQDPGNVGTILRVAEAFGADACLATSGTAAIFNSKTVRASAGSLFRIPHIWDVDFTQTCAALKASHIQVIGTSPAANETIDSWDWNKPCAIAIGNEGAGLTKSEMQMCDIVLRIPTSGAVESLNSAIAAAVVLYEAAKQRKRIQ